MGLTKEKIIGDFPEECKRLEEIAGQWCKKEKGISEQEKTEYRTIVEEIRNENQANSHSNPDEDYRETYCV